jgi:hypothetical protein
MGHSLFTLYRHPVSPFCINKMAAVGEGSNEE